MVVYARKAINISQLFILIFLLALSFNSSSNSLSSNIERNLWGTNTTSSCSSETMLVHNEYLGACSYTQDTSFTLSADSHITRIRIWYDTSVEAQSLSVSLSGPNSYSNSSSSLSTGNGQGNWQEAWWNLEQSLKAGTYTLTANSTSICANPSGDTTLILYGCDENEDSSADTNTIDINSGLVAYYPFNGNANDESGNGNHGSVSGATLIEDRFGVTQSAYSFDGNDDSIIISDGTSFNFDQYLTLSLWVNPDATQNQHAAIIDKSHSHDSNGGYIKSWTLQGDGQGANNYLFGYIHNDTSYDIPVSVVASTWNHVVIIKENDVLKYYLNGTFIASEQQANALIDSNNSNPLVIGNTNNWSRYFSGLIDDIYIYNRALSESEIQQLYQLNDSSTATTDNTDTTSDETNNNSNGNSIELTQLDNLDELIPYPILYDNTPLIYRYDEPLGMSSVSMVNAWGTINGDTIRIINTLLNGQPVYLDFVLNTADIKFMLQNYSNGNGDESFGTALPGMTLNSDLTDVTIYGPPLSMDIIPFKIGSDYWAASFIFNTSTLSFDLSWASPISDGFSDLINNNITESHRNYRFLFGSSPPSTIDEYIQEKIKVNQDIPSSEEWRSVAQKCGSAVVNTIMPGGSLAETVAKAMVDKGDKVWDDMRYHYQRGDKTAALQAFGQFAWVLTVENAESNSVMINGLKSLASSIGEDLPTAVGESSECKENYQHVMKKILESMAVKGLDTLSKLPLGSMFSCIADATYQAGKAIREWGTERIVKAFYQEWKKLEESEAGSGNNIFSGEMVTVSISLENPVGYYADRDFGGDRAIAEAHFKKLFKQWYDAEKSASELKTQLETIKSLYESLDSSTLTAIKKNLADKSNKADAFARFEELFSKTKAQLIPYVPYNTSDDRLNSIVDGILYKWGQDGANAKPQVWKDAVEEQLIEWQPDLFVETPKVCLIEDTNTDDTIFGANVFLVGGTFDLYSSECFGLTYPFGAQFSTDGFVDHTSNNSDTSGLFTTNGRSVKGEYVDNYTNKSCSGNVSGTSQDNLSVSLSCKFINSYTTNPNKALNGEWIIQISSAPLDYNGSSWSFKISNSDNINYISSANLNGNCSYGMYPNASQTLSITFWDLE